MEDKRTEGRTETDGGTGWNAYGGPHNNRLCDWRETNVQRRSISL